MILAIASTGNDFFHSLAWSVCLLSCSVSCFSCVPYPSCCRVHAWCPFDRLSYSFTLTSFLDGVSAVLLVRPFCRNDYVARLPMGIVPTIG